MDLRLSQGRYRKGEWVYTCSECGREGEREWMGEHLKLAHGLRGARERDEAMKELPRRREYVNIRSMEEAEGRLGAGH